MEHAFKDVLDSYLQFARIALTGRPQDIQLLIHKASKKFKSSHPDFANSLVALLQESPTRSSPLRKHADTPLPVDLDSRLQLLRLDNAQLDHDPVFSEPINKALSQVLAERKNQQSLLKHGLTPTKSLLFNGPPGVGKTMAAKWVALKLGKPLLVLDLTAVMSSFLGRTGNNIRFVLDYAKKTDCVLLIDELDAVAKRRDDATEVGELKRLVTVLLQEIDDWPASGLLIAATNHPDLLDPAVWRRFEVVIKFENPTIEEIERLVETRLTAYVSEPKMWSKVLSHAFIGKSFSEVERLLTIARKASAIENELLEEKIKDLLISGSNLTREQKANLAQMLVENNIMSQRKTQELTGIARETIRKMTKK